ncbi:MAG: hypothetical protein NTZ33_10460 [Bacteroidetes bacterium]|nr:hypothetical protein [Bacteroidota bacterium]
MENSYDILISKLDEFIRKYYKNRLIKGLLYVVSLITVFFIIVNTLEYFGHFDILIRSILFFSFVGFSGIISFRFFIIPLLKLYKIGKIISYEQAASIIGTHFSTVQDKLLNTLQLKNIASKETENTELIEASINQKIKELKPIPFINAVDLKSNLKYIKYALAPVLIVLIVFLARPSAITESSKRIIKYNTFYEKPSPFQFQVENKKLEAFQQQDFDLSVKVTGTEIPDEVYVLADGVKYKLQKQNTVSFSYTFKNLQKNIKFQLQAAEITSVPYILNVIAKPIILNFDIQLIYPAYTGKKTENIENIGDLNVPDGTRAEWRFVTRETSALNFSFIDRNIVLNQKGNNIFNYTSILRKSFSYSVKPENKQIKLNDSLIYSVNVIPDAFPFIQVDEMKDSLYEKRLYFRGVIKDDYGFNKLSFHYRSFNRKDTLTLTENTVEIPFNKSINQQEFFHYFDMENIVTQAGDEVEYYFEVSDNDGVNGSKVSRSQKMYFKAPTYKEIEKQTEKTNQEIKDDLQHTIKDAQKLQKQIKDLNRKLLEKKALNWEDKKQAKELLDAHKQLQESIEKINQQLKESEIKEQQYKKIDEEIAQKQKELEKLFQEIMTDEMKKKFEELQKLMENIDKDKVSEMLEKMKMNSEDISKQLDRNLEVFKQLEFEKKLTENLDKLDKLAKEQKKLAEETAKGDKPVEEMQKKQEELNKSFEDIRKNMSDLEQKNKELENPNNFKRDENKENAISQEQKNSSESLSNKKSGKASKSQQKAAEQMQELSDKMKKDQEEMELEQMGEDIENLRTILKNLVKISFRQEDLANRLQQISVKDPKYQDIINEQGNIKDDLKMVEDSLLALSKRQIKVKSIITKEINAINHNVEQALSDLLAMNTVGYLGNFQNQNAIARQQYVMTSVNNLALLLNEAMENMKQEMNSKKKGGKPNASCNKPGSGGKPSKSAASMRKMQEELNKQLEQMKNGNKPNGKQGQQGQQGQGQKMNEQLARMAAQQEAIRRQMQEYMDELKKQGEKPGNGLNDLMNQMEKTETDLVNKIISQETLNRQKQILTRLLEHEKAEQKRDQEEKRESTEAKVQNFGNQNLFLQYKRIKSNEQEILKSVPPTMNSFYKNKVNEYFYNFK